MRIPIGCLLFIIASLSLAKPKQSIVVDDAWIRLVPPTSNATSLYLNIRNNSKQRQEIERVECPTVAGSAMFHESKTHEGMVSMHHIDNPRLNPGEAIRFEPSGLHIMLMGVKQEALVENKTHECKIKFSKFAEVTFSVVIKK